MCERDEEVDVAELENVALRKIFSECDEFTSPSSLSSSSSSSSPSISSEVPVSTLVEYIRENTRAHESADLLDELQKSLYEVSLDGQVNWPLFQRASRRWIRKVRDRLHRQDGNNNDRDSHDSNGRWYSRIKPNEMEDGLDMSRYASVWYSKALIENANGKKELDKKFEEDAAIARNQSPLSSCSGNVDFMRLSNESSYSQSIVSTVGCDETEVTAEMTEEAGIAEVELRLRVRRFDEENAVLREELVHAEESIADFQRQLDSLRHKLNQSGERCAQLEKENDEQKEMLNEAEKREKQCKVALQKAEKNQTTMIKKLEAVETEKQSISILNEKLEKIVKEKVESEYRLVVIREELEERRAECELFREKFVQLENDNVNLQESYEHTTCHLRNKIRDLKSQIVELQARQSNYQEDRLSLTPPIGNSYMFEHSTPCKMTEVHPEDSLCAELRASGFLTEYGRNSVRFQELEEELAWYNNEIRETIKYLETVTQELASRRDERYASDSCLKKMDDSKMSDVQILKQRISSFSAMVIEMLRKCETRDSYSQIQAEPIAVAHLNEFKIMNFADQLQLLNEKKKMEIVENEASSSQGTSMTSHFPDNKSDSPFLISTLSCPTNYSISVQERTIIDPIVAAIDKIIQGSDSQESSPRDHSPRPNPRSRFTYTLPSNRLIPETDHSYSETSLESSERHNNEVSPVFVVSSKGDGVARDVFSADLCASTSENSCCTEVDANESKVQVYSNAVPLKLDRPREDRNKLKFNSDSPEFESDLSASESKDEASVGVKSGPEVLYDSEINGDNQSPMNNPSMTKRWDFGFNPDDLRLDLERLELRSLSSNSSFVSSKGATCESPWSVIREIEDSVDNNSDKSEEPGVSVAREVPSFRSKNVPKRKTSVFHRSFDISALYDDNEANRGNSGFNDSCVKRSWSSPSVQDNSEDNDYLLTETPIMRNKILGPYRTVTLKSESSASSPSTYLEGSFSETELSVVDGSCTKGSGMGSSFDLAPARLRIPQVDGSATTCDVNKSWNDTVLTMGNNFLNQRPTSLAFGSMTGTFDGSKQPRDRTFNVIVETSGVANLSDLSSSVSCLEHQETSFNQLDSCTSSAAVNICTRGVISRRPRRVSPTGDDGGGNDDRDDCGSAIDVECENPAVALAMSSGEDTSDSEVDLNASMDDRRVAPSIVPLDDKIVTLITGDKGNDSGRSACADKRETISAVNRKTMGRSLLENESSSSEAVVGSNSPVLNEKGGEQENGEVEEAEEGEEEESLKIFPSLTDTYMRESGIAISSSDISEFGENLSEDELERKYTALSVGLGTDRATLSRRMALSFRQRDQAERNLACEVQKMHQDIQASEKGIQAALAPLCVDRESIERVERVRHQLEMIAQCAHRVSCAAETLGAAHQEHRLSRAALLADRYLQVLRTRCEKLMTELADTKRILSENNIVLEENSNELGDDISRVRYRGVPSNNRSMISRRRASIATIFRPLGSAQDVVKENTRQRNSVSGRMTLRRPSFNYETQKLETDKLCRTDSSSSVGELRDIFEQAESRRNSREENNNNLDRSQSSNFSIGSCESTDSSIWSTPKEDPNLEEFSDDSPCIKSGFSQRTSRILRMIRTYVPWIPMFWCILISFFLGFYVKHVVSSVNTCTGAPLRWWSIEEILDQYIQVRNVAPRPI